jgi:hypothetical protein
MPTADVLLHIAYVPIPNEYEQSVGFQSSKTKNGRTKHDPTLHINSSEDTSYILNSNRVSRA